MGIPTLYVSFLVSSMLPLPLLTQEKGINVIDEFEINRDGSTHHFLLGSKDAHRE
jgi:hypothetical protein